MNAEEHLRRLQAEAEPSGYHRELKAWVDDHSSVGRVLLSIDEWEQANPIVENAEEAWVKAHPYAAARFCRFCQAMPGKACRTDEGVITSRPHMDRRGRL